MTEALIRYKYSKPLCNNGIEASLKDLKRMISDNNILNYLEWKFFFIVNIDKSDEQFGVVISKKITIYFIRETKQATI